MEIGTKSIAIAAVAALAFGGSAIANAADSTTATTTTATATNAAPAGGQRAGEELVTGDLAAKLTAAAEAKLGSGATIDKVETDADGAAYEAHATKADGTRVTVLFDEDATVSSVEDGMGPGAAPAPSAAP
jgi:hypothetical protein